MINDDKLYLIVCIVKKKKKNESPRESYDHLPNKYNIIRTNSYLIIMLKNSKHTNVCATHVSVNTQKPVKKNLSFLECLTFHIYSHRVDFIISAKRHREELSDPGIRSQRNLFI